MTSILGAIYCNHYFATLFDAFWKIPLYSAYVLGYEPAQIVNKPQGPKKWQGDKSIEDFIQANKYLSNLKSLGIAVGDDYQYDDNNKNGNDVLYDRGHLAPAGYFPPWVSKTTNTYTNVVPQIKQLNSQLWQLLEGDLKELMKEECEEGAAFFVTGVKGMNNIIGVNRIVVPKWMYTVTCCAAMKNDKNAKFSLGYIAHNVEASKNAEYYVGSIDNLQNKFLKDYQFFGNGCSNNNDDKANEFAKKIVNKKGYKKIINNE